MPEAVLILSNIGEPRETFCHDCGQLRLWLKREEPAACGNCASHNIEVGLVGSDYLGKLRDEWIKGK